MNFQKKEKKAYGEADRLNFQKKEKKEPKKIKEKVPPPFHKEEEEEEEDLL